MSATVRCGRRLLFGMITALAACDQHRSSPTTDLSNAAADSGRAPTNVRTVAIQGNADLTENSAATASARQPGIWFTLNDSGHEPVLFAIDTTGAPRGRWTVRDAKNVDWESAGYGPCIGSGSVVSRDSSARCVYIGDTGDNNAAASSRAIYQVREPEARDRGASGNLSATRLAFRYADGPHDVEAMYVAPDATVYLITKLSPRGSRGAPRPALVFQLPASAWSAPGVQQAELVDSLPIVPGSAFARFITDAALSSDAKFLAVRTYTEVFVFSTDPATGRARTNVKPAVCDIASLEEQQGEGITWLDGTHRLLLTSEGHGAPFHLVDCPLPQ